MINIFFLTPAYKQLLNNIQGQMTKNRFIARAIKMQIIPSTQTNLEISAFHFCNFMFFVERTCRLK